MNRGWVFDLDDTLYLERDYVKSGLRAVDSWARLTLGISGIFELAWDMFLAGIRGTTISRAFDTVGRQLTSDETSAAVNVYRNHNPNIHLCPDAYELLKQLSSCRDHVGIVTDGPAASQRAKLRALELDRRGYIVAITDDHGPAWHKPNTPAFEYVQSALGIEPERCIYIADNPLKDFVAPRLLGWETVRIVRPLGLHSLIDSRPTEVDRTVESLAIIAQEQGFG